MKYVGIIGYGNMGEAIAQGLIKGYPELSIGMLEKNPKRLAAVRDRFPGQIFLDYKDLFTFADVIVLAVKPQDLGILCADIKGLSNGKKIISIIAGKKIDYFRNELDTPFIARFMPNIAAKVRKSFVAVSFGTEVDEEFKRDCFLIAQAIGTPLEVPEYLLAPVTGLSGSGIAYVFSFIHALALGGTKTGIPYQTALSIALSTIEGAIAMVKEAEEHPVSLLCKVTSPAGTTIEGIQALEDGAFTGTVMKAVERAGDKAKSLES